MTRTQRRRHLVMWIIIGPLTLLGIVAALAVRHGESPARAQDASNP